MKTNYSIVTFFLLMLTKQIASQENMSNALRNEVESHSLQENITKETHPVLYNMIKRIATKASVPMPRYIQFFTAQQTVNHYNKYTQTSTTHTVFKNFESYVNWMGDLYICYEVLTNASDLDEIEGIIALALAEKSNNKPLKLIATGASTIASALTCAYYLNKKDNFIKEVFFPNHFSHHNGYTEINTFSAQDRQNIMEMFIGTFMILPTFITTRLAANYCQKQIDLKAAQSTSVKNVAKAIMRVEKVKEKYTQESPLSRIMTTLKLKGILDTLAYPFRSFKAEERISYLH